MSDVASGSGERILTSQAAATLKRVNDGKIPTCRRCKKPLKEGAKYYSRKLRHRAYYHLACWRRLALAPDRDDHGPE